MTILGEGEGDAEVEMPIKLPGMQRQSLLHPP